MMPIQGIISGSPVVAGGYGDDFVLEMATTGAAETITIPCQNVGTFTAEIDWGDATTSTITTWDDADLAHEYADAGDHIIRISGTFPNIYFNNVGDALKLKRILNWGDTGLVNLDRAFWGCANLTTVTSQTSNMVGLITMIRVFRACTSLTSADVSDWNTTNVTNISNAFRDCTSLTTLNVGGWDTANVVNMANTFDTCSSLADVAIDNWDIESVTSFVDFMDGVTLSTARYDATLIAWDAQNPVDSLAVNFGSSTYTAGGAAATARASLESGDLWTITDGGTA